MHLSVWVTPIHGHLRIELLSSRRGPSVIVCRSAQARDVRAADMHRSRFEPPASYRSFYINKLVLPRTWTQHWRTQLIILLQPVMLYIPFYACALNAGGRCLRISLLAFSCVTWQTYGLDKFLRILRWCMTHTTRCVSLPFAPARSNDAYSAPHMICRVASFSLATRKRSL